MEESKVAVLVRIRQSLKARLVELAKSEHRSFNQQIEFLLEHAVSSAAMDPGTESPERKGPTKRKF
jgi:hypothetical protein